MQQAKNEPYKATTADKWAIYGTWFVLAIVATATNGVAIVMHGLAQSVSQTDFSRTLL